jgi:hypothetical protein
MHYSKVDSGLKSLDQVGIVLDRQVKQIKKFGYKAVYDAIFDSAAGDVRLGTRLWLFGGAKGASQWLESSRKYSIALQLQEITAPTLGDESWAVHGVAEAGAAEIISHAFRVGNLVVLVSYSSQRTPLSEPDALATAQIAAARLR